MTTERSKNIQALIDYFNDGFMKSFPYMKPDDLLVSEGSYKMYEERYGVNLRGVLPLSQNHHMPDANDPSSIYGLACPLGISSVLDSHSP